MGRRDGGAGLVQDQRGLQWLRIQSSSWLHPRRLPVMNRQEDRLSLGAGDGDHQHPGSASLHLLQPPKLRCKSYQTSPTAGYPSLCCCGPGRFGDIDQERNKLFTTE
eukprot:s5113_g1.t1